MTIDALVQRRARVRRFRDDYTKPEHFADPPVVSTVDLSKRLAHLASVPGAFAQTVHGDCMWPYYGDGDLILIDPAKRTRNG